MQSFVVPAERRAGVALDSLDSSRYRPEIDGLRAVAILSVVGFHAFPDIVSGGFVGVDIFFVISGFLITRLIVRELDTGTFSLVSFFARRVRRLLPAAAVVYAATVAGGWFILLPDAFRELGVSLGGASLVYANLVFYKLAGYFDSPAHEKPLLHTWSLSIEEQFYLIWPLLLMLLLQLLPRRAVLVFSVVALVASLAIAQYMLGHDQRFAFYLLQARAWELLTGAVLALTLATSIVRLGTASSEVLAWVGLLLIGGSILLLNSRSPFPGVLAVPACVGTVILLASSQQHLPSACRLLAIRPMAFVGLISYSLYLWHWPILSLVHYSNERAPQGLELFFLLIASVVLATLSWKLVERPFRSHGGVLWFPERTALVAGAITIAIFAAVGRVLVVTDGLPSRLDEAARAVYQQKIGQNSKRLACENVENAFRNETLCNVGRPKPEGASYDAVIIGDSQADQFVPAFAPLMVRAGLSARQLTQNGCGLVIGLARAVETSEVKYKPCPVFQHTIMRFIDANPGLRLAILSTYWPHYEYMPRINGIELPFKGEHSNGNPNAREVFEQYLRDMITFLDQRGIRVLLVGGLPQLAGDLPLRCAVKALRANLPGSNCETPAQPVLAQLEWSNALLKRLALENAHVSAILPTDAMCTERQCATVMDATFLYFDRGHLNATGSAVLGARFKLPELGAR